MGVYSYVFVIKKDTFYVDDGLNIWKLKKCSILYQKSELKGDLKKVLENLKPTDSSCAIIETN